MLASAGSGGDDVVLSDFDPPRAGMEGSSPCRAEACRRGHRRGSDVQRRGVGRWALGVPEALQEFSAGQLNAPFARVAVLPRRLRDGRGMSVALPPFARRAQISRHVEIQQAGFDRSAWSTEMEQLRDLPLGRSFQSVSQSLPTPSADEIRRVMIENGKFGPDDELNCGACGYETCRAHAVAILRGLGRGRDVLALTPLSG